MVGVSFPPWLQIWGKFQPREHLQWGALVSSLGSSLTELSPPKAFLRRKPPQALTMSIMDHSPTTGVVTVIVILIAIAALGALILGCWCYLRLQRISQSEDEESIVGDGETKEPFLLVQYSAKGPCVERKAKLTPGGPEVHG
ncbi:stannin [Camelus ferus]|nr:stannin [Camelus ferus]